MGYSQFYRIGKHQFLGFCSKNDVMRMRVARNWKHIHSGGTSLQHGLGDVVPFGKGLFSGNMLVVGRVTRPWYQRHETKWESSSRMKTRHYYKSLGKSVKEYCFWPFICLFFSTPGKREPGHLLEHWSSKRSRMGFLNWEIWTPGAGGTLPCLQAVHMGIACPSASGKLT